jgi:hypothetical protein
MGGAWSIQKTITNPPQNHNFDYTNRIQSEFQNMSAWKSDQIRFFYFWLVVSNMNFIFHVIYWIILQPLTNSYIFQDG